MRSPGTSLSLSGGVDGRRLFWFELAAEGPFSIGCLIRLGYEPTGQRHTQLSTNLPHRARGSTHRPQKGFLFCLIQQMADPACSRKLQAPQRPLRSQAGQLRRDLNFRLLPSHTRLLLAPCDAESGERPVAPLLTTWRILFYSWLRVGRCARTPTIA